MGPHPQTATSPQPRVFSHSLDWRFLLPLVAPQKTCLLFEENEDFSQTLEQVGMGVSQQLSFSELSDHKNEGFHLLVMPFGLPAGRTGAGRESRVQFYFSIRRFLDSDGYLLAGFNGGLNLRPSSQSVYQASTPRRIAGELSQAGFKSVKIYGAMPTLQIPEYIFDLDPRAIDFALRNRFRRKPAVLQSLRLLAGIVGWKRFSDFLPCYFAVAAT
jgi:hypothetical protein